MPKDATKKREVVTAEMNKNNPEDQHKLSVDALCTRYICNTREGLTDLQREDRRKKHGRNIMAAKLSKEQIADNEFWNAALPESTFVRVNSTLVACNNTTLVVGDLCVLSEGNIVAADMRVIEAHNLTVDMSPLIAERDLKPRGLDSTDDDQLMTANMLLAGSYVTSGIGMAIVVATGDNTIMGRTVSGAAADQQRPLFKSFPKKMQKAHEALRTKTSVWLRDMFAMKRIARPTYVLMPIRGVLTFLSRMVVETLHLDQSTFASSDGALLAQSNTTLVDFHRALTLCNTCRYDRLEDDFILSTNHYETAIFSWLSKLKQPNIAKVSDVRDAYPLVFSHPYKKSLGYQFAVYNSGNDDKPEYHAAIEGQPEAVVAACTSAMMEGKLVAFDSKARQSFDAAVETISKRGESVIAVATMPLPLPKGEKKLRNIDKLPSTGATFLGLMSLTNPAKPNAKETLSRLQKLGMRPVLFTSDHQESAEALLRSCCGLSTERLPAEPVSQVSKVPQRVSVTGEQLADYLPNGNPRYSDALLGSPVAELILVSRCRPEQKLFVTEMLERQNETCLALAKGASDGAMLEKASIGVVLRDLGPHFIKESADVIVCDNRVSSLCDAIEECRKDKVVRVSSGMPNERGSSQTSSSSSAM